MNRFIRFIRAIPAGDQAIAGFLAVIVLLACFLGTGALLRSFQVVTPAYGGTLTEGIVGSPRFINPLLAISDSDRDMVQLTFAGLMGHSADGTLIPVLAESFTTSPDGTIYTFKLRKGIEFSDGTPITSEDVVYTVRKAQDPSLKSPVYASWSNVRVEALDAETVRFTLSKAYAPFIEDVTLGILPKHIWQNVSGEDFAFDSHNVMPVGAGPFVAQSASHDSDGTISGFTLKSFSKYALGKPYISRVQILFYSNTADLQTAFKNGKISSTYGFATHNAKSAPYARIFGVFFNSEQEPAFKNIGVRKALSLAVDRTELTKDLLGGYATPLMGPLPAGSDITPIPLPDDSTRLEEARKSLVSAGYEYNETAHTWSKGGEVLSIKLVTSNVPELKAVAAAVQKDWSALGIPVELELHDPSTLTQSVIRPRAYGALLFGEVIGKTPDLYAFWSSTERTSTGLNIANYSDTDVDALLVKSRAEQDPAIRREILSEIQDKIASTYPAVFLYTPDFVYNPQANIQRTAVSQISSPSDRFWDIENWYRYTEHVWPAFVPSSRTGTKP